MLDALRADTFSRYAPDYLEPILRRSAWFTRAYAASSMTNYAVPSMFSGQYVGAMAAGQDMSAREPLRLYLALPAALRRDGYRVEALTLLDVGVFAAAFDSMSGGDADPPPRGGEKFGFYAGALTRTAIRRLLNPPDAPLMLWVHHADTHAPYTPIDRNVFPEPDASDYERAAAYSLFRSAPLMDVILRSQRQDDTVLVISSDHGEELGERGRLGHGSDLVETALRVPLVLHVPGCPAGTYDQAVSLIELAPTLAYLTGVGSVRWSLLDRLGGKTSPVSIGAEVYTGARSEHAIVTQEAKLRVDVRSGGRTHTDLQQGSGDDAIVSGETAMSLDESYARWLASVSLWRP